MQFLLEAFLLRLQISFADISLDRIVSTTLSKTDFIAIPCCVNQVHTMMADGLSLPMWTRTKLSDYVSPPWVDCSGISRTVQQYIVTHFFNVCKDNITAVSTVTFLIYNTTPQARR